ncbi:MAG: Rod binding domain-containing protein [Pirellulaceae bacterium]|jgi:Rod binding domain-containing protein
MQIPTMSHPASAMHSATKPTPPAQLGEGAKVEKSDIREAFDQFVGQTFFSQMLSTMRKTVGEPAYFHGGRAEEIFQSQLDQVLSEEMTDASADQFTGPMFELFMLGRS